jgi:hypothetical protein
MSMTTTIAELKLHSYGCKFMVIKITLCQQQQQPSLYSQTNWGRLEMKPHELKNREKERKRRGKTKGDKKPNRKRRKINNTLS